MSRLNRKAHLLWGVVAVGSQSRKFSMVAYLCELLEKLQPFKWLEKLLYLAAISN